MGTFRLKSHTRRARSIQVISELDLWVERMATLWGVSYSEAANRLLHEQMELRNQLGGVFETERGGDGTPHLVHVLLERFKEDLCKGMDRLWEEVKKIKGNLYVLESMHDRAIALGGAQQHDSWRREVQNMMKQRGNRV